MVINRFKIKIYNINTENNLNLLFKFYNRLITLILTPTTKIGLAERKIDIFYLRL